MKSVKKFKQSSVKYPCLKVSGSNDGRVVLFTDARTGTLVSERSDDPFYQIGHYSTAWTEESFIDFNGTITLSND